MGRFLSVDPLTKSYPWYTPYQFAGNKPINSVDLDGLEEIKTNEQGKLYIHFQSDKTTVSHNPAPVKIYRPAPVLEKQPYNRWRQFKTKWEQGDWKYKMGHWDDWMAYQAISGPYTAVTGDVLEGGAAYPKEKLDAKLMLLTEVHGALAGNAARFLDEIGDARKTAAAFLKDSKVVNIERHLDAIDFGDDVYVSTLKPGDKVYRYSKLGSSDPKHYFTTEKGLLPGELGKQSIYKEADQYIIEEFTINKETQVLNSRINLFDENVKGQKQIFSTEIEQNSTVKQISSDEYFNN